MDARYQIVLLDPGATGRAGRLRQTLEKRLEDLGLDPRTDVQFLDASDFHSRDSRPAPVAGVYFGHPDQTPADTEVAKQLLALPAVVFPVVEDLKGFTSLVPAVLHPVNGVRLKPEDGDLEEIAGLVLEALSLLRQTRRLFISYRRDESRAVALQLYELLDGRSYDVFLDTHGVRPGEPFQEVLWHRLADSDVTILLDSPNFLASQWTRMELAEASNLLIGILQVLWPGHKGAEIAKLAFPLLLADADFDPPQASPSGDSRLKPDAALRIATEVERLRARSLAARRDDIVRQFCLAANAAGVSTTIQPYQYILASKNAKKVAVIPAVGVPTAQQIQEIEAKLDPRERPDVSEGALLYDHRGIRNRWLTHLDWLGRYLPIKTFRVTEMNRWLAQL